jgi:hypothetical protein
MILRLAFGVRVRRSAFDAWRSVERLDIVYNGVL